MAAVVELTLVLVSVNPIPTTVPSLLTVVALANAITCQAVAVPVSNSSPRETQPIGCSMVSVRGWAANDPNDLQGVGETNKPRRLGTSPKPYPTLISQRVLRQHPRPLPRHVPLMPNVKTATHARKTYASTISVPSVPSFRVILVMIATPARPGMCAMRRVLVQER